MILDVFAKPGESIQQVGGDCPEGWVQMRSPRPDIDSLANANGTWVAAQRAYPRFMGNEKLDLFTHNEQLAIVTATMADPVVKLVYDRLLGSAYWTYEDPETEQGLSLLQDKGLLTDARKAEIVARMTGQEA